MCRYMNTYAEDPLIYARDVGDGKVRLYVETVSKSGEQSENGV